MESARESLTSGPVRLVTVMRAWPSFCLFPCPFLTPYFFTIRETRSGLVHFPAPAFALRYAFGG